MDQQLPLPESVQAAHLLIEKKFAAQSWLAESDSSLNEGSSRTTSESLDSSTTGCSSSQCIFQEQQLVPKSLTAHHHQHHQGTLVATSPTKAQHEQPFLDWSILKNDGRLYGRQKEFSQLQDVFRKRMQASCITRTENDTNNLNTNTKNNNDDDDADDRGSDSSMPRPELVLVSGKSGAGKTVLVEHALRSLVERNGGYYLVGKFDQMHQRKVVSLTEPYGPFLTALTQLALSLEATETADTMHRLREETFTKVGMELAQVLILLVPALGRVLKFDSSSDESDQEGDREQQQQQLESISLLQQDRLKLAITKFFRIICSILRRPVILVMDDLQWAGGDLGSLNLIEALVAPGFCSNDNKASGAETQDTTNLMVVGICRSNEVPLHHAFAGMLRRLEDEKKASIFHIEVRNLTVELTNDLLSEVLKQPKHTCLPLSQILHEKSDGGNPFFLVQLLKALIQRGVLVPNKIEAQDHCDGGEYEWCWYESQWNALIPKDLKELDVVDLVSHQIYDLPLSCRRLLKTLAFLGAGIDYNTIVTILGTTIDGMDTQAALDIVVEEQMLVEQLPHKKYRFVHDRIQEAALAFVPEECQPMFHLSIGLALFHQLLGWEIEEHLYLVVNQLFYGASLLINEEDKKGLATLCAKAGKKATQASDFETAKIYFEMGMTLLPARYWRDEYHLSLDLFCSRAEAQCCTSDFDSMQKTLDEILENCRSLNDKLRAYETQIFSLGNRCLFKEAIALGKEVMAKLGENFPSKPRLIYLIPDFLEIQWRLSSKSDEDILSLPMIDECDHQRNSARTILNSLCSFAFCADAELCPFLSLRAVKSVLLYGQSELSALVFAAYSLMLCAAEEYSKGCRYGRLALRLLEQFPHTRGQVVARVHSMLYGMVFPWCTPFGPAIDHLQPAVLLAAESGDVECAMFTAVNFISHSCVAGTNFYVVDEAIKQYIGLMTKQGPWLALTRLKENLVDNFMGRSENPVELSFDMSPQQNRSKQDFELYEWSFWLSQLQLAYHFGDYDLALISAKRLRKLTNEVAKASINITVAYFYDGLTVFEAAWRSRSTWRRWEHISWARKLLNKLCKLSKLIPENIHHKVLILRGELEALNGNLPRALEFFQFAAVSASTNGFVHLHALARERSAVALRRLGKDRNGMVQATELTKLAIAGYYDWGASAVAVHLNQQLQVGALSQPDKVALT